MLVLELNSRLSMALGDLLAQGKRWGLPQTAKYFVIDMVVGGGGCVMMTIHLSSTVVVYTYYCIYSV